MTRALLFALAVSVAATAQTPSLPLPGADPALPLPGASEAPKKKKAVKKDEPSLSLPTADAKKKPEPALPLPSAEPKPALSLPLPEPKKDAPALTLPGVEKPAVHAQQAQKAQPLPNAEVKPSQAAQASSKTGLGDKAQPAAPMTARAQDLRLRTSGSDHDLWTVRAFLGAERSTEEAYTEPVSHSRLGVEGTRWFSTNWLVRGEVDYRASKQPYVPLHAAANRPVLVDENRFDVLAGLGYDVGSLLLKSGRLELTPMLGVHYIGIRNDAFPSDLIGANLSGRARFALSSAVLLHATVGYTYNFAVAKTQNSALKSPVSDVAMRAGIQLPLAGNYALELDYSGDVLSFENTYRVAHGAALGFGSTF